MCRFLIHYDVNFKSLLAIVVKGLTRGGGKGFFFF